MCVAKYSPKAGGISQWAPPPISIFLRVCRVPCASAGARPTGRRTPAPGSTRPYSSDRTSDTEAGPTPVSPAREEAPGAEVCRGPVVAGYLTAALESE